MSSIKTNEESEKKKDRKVILSTLWIFVLLNYIYADIYSLTFNPILQKESWMQFMSGYVGSIPITQSLRL